MKIVVSYEVFVGGPRDDFDWESTEKEFDSIQEYSYWLTFMASDKAPMFRDMIVYVRHIENTVPEEFYIFEGEND